jgi:hypothetical protein
VTCITHQGIFFHFPPWTAISFHFAKYIIAQTCGASPPARAGKGEVNPCCDDEGIKSTPLLRVGVELLPA